MPNIDDISPPLIDENSWYYPGLEIDPAAYLLKPGTVTGPNKHTAGQWANARPYLSNGSDIYVWPVGVEGIQEQGQATLGLHNYIGDVEADGVIVHRDESRITLSGTFPGLTSTKNWIALRTMLRSIPHGDGFILWLPGILGQEQYVLPENWSFNHQAGDNTHSVDYTVTFVRIGTHGKVSDPSGSIPPPNPGSSTTPAGKPTHIFTIKANVRTLRAVAGHVFHNVDKWPILVEMNRGQLNRWKRKHPDIPTHKLPTYRWPIGTKFRY